MYEKLAEAVRSDSLTWNANAGAYPVRVPTLKSILCSASYVATAHDGYLTDGKVALRLTPGEVAKLPPMSEGGRSLAGILREYLGKPFDPAPLDVVAARPAIRGADYLLRGEGCGGIVVDAKYVKLTYKRRPSATLHQGRKLGPVYVAVGGEAVGLIMPIDDPGLKTARIRGAEEASAVDAFFEALTPAQEAEIEVGTKHTYSGRKRRFVKGPVRHLMLSEDRDGVWWIGDDKPLGPFYSDADAVAFAKRVLRYAHGFDAKRLPVFHAA